MVATTLPAVVRVVDLPTGTTVTGTEIFEAVQTTAGVGQSVQLTLSQMVSNTVGALPTGGNTGQILNKLSTVNYSSQWSNITQFVAVGTSLATTGSATSIVAYVPNNAIGTAQIASSLGIASSLSIGTLLTVGGTATFNGTAIFNSTAIFNGTAVFTGGLQVTGTTLITGTFGVVGTSLMTGVHGVVGTSQFTGAFNIAGTTVLTGTFGLIGTSLLTGVHGVVGTSQFTGAFNIAGTTIVTGTLNVSGTATLTSVVIFPALTSGLLQVSGTGVIGTSTGTKSQRLTVATGAISPVWKNTIINVTDYGATGDGSTDDTNAINAAIAAANNSACPLYFPQPTVSYRMTASATPFSSSGLLVYGDGPDLSIIAVDYTPASSTAAFITMQGGGVQIKDLCIRKANTRTGGYAITNVWGATSGGSDFAILDNIKITGTGGTPGTWTRCVNYDGSARTSNVGIRDQQITNCNFFNATEANIFITSGVGFQIIETDVFGGDATPSNANIVVTATATTTTQYLYIQGANVGSLNIASTSGFSIYAATSGTTTFAATAHHSPGIAPMGYGLPAAIGACFAAPGRQVVCLTGDGGTMFNLQELQTIVHHKLPILIVLYSNHGYKTMQVTQGNHFGREAVSSPESDISWPILSKVAYAFGIQPLTCSNNSEMAAHLGWVVKEARKPFFLELNLSPSQTIAPLVKTKVEDGKFVPVQLDQMWPYLEESN